MCWNKSFVSTTTINNILTCHFIILVFEVLQKEKCHTFQSRESQTRKSLFYTSWKCGSQSSFREYVSPIFEYLWVFRRRVVFLYVTSQTKNWMSSLFPWKDKESSKFVKTKTESVNETPHLEVSTFHLPKVDFVFYCHVKTSY
jgi:hypothetical protein